MIIGLVGEKLAGKDTVAEYLISKYSAFHVRTSHILDELLNTLGLPITRRNEIDAGRGMEMVFGEKIIGQALLSRIRRSDAKLIINNGLRQRYQFDDARALGAKIIYVTAPAKLRHERSLHQKESDKDKGSFEQFLSQEEEWTEVNIPMFGQEADFKIENTGTLDELYGKIDEIIKKIGNRQ